jgi:hypothetical protein
MAAVSVNCLEVVESLLAWGEKQVADAGDSSSTSALDTLCAAKDSDGKTAYQLAMDKGFKDIAKLIKVCRACSCRVLVLARSIVSLLLRADAKQLWHALDVREGRVHC